MVYMHGRVLFSHKEEWNYVICMKMDATGDHNVGQDKPNITFSFHAESRLKWWWQ
jgi:hypothetical protein